MPHSASTIRPVGWHHCRMNPIISIIDDFFRDPIAIREELLSGTFDSIINPLDGVEYPAINKDLPAALLSELVMGVEVIVGQAIKPGLAFARATYAGLSAPNKIHSDLVMGRYAAHVYLSEEWPEHSGTSFYKNKILGFRHKAEMDPSSIRSNEPEDWERYCAAQAKLNRLLIHRGEAWHLAEPIGGWGDSPESGRLVVTMFLDV